jgi:hypothetical protein
MQPFFGQDGSDAGVNRPNEGGKKKSIGLIRQSPVYTLRAHKGRERDPISNKVSPNLLMSWSSLIREVKVIESERKE